MKHGFGFWSKGNPPKQSTYEGDYFKDKKHGKGKFVWASGNVYEGGYANDE